MNIITISQKTIIQKSLNQIKRFINSALKRHIDYIDKSNTELYHLIETIGKQGKEFDRINVYFLINGFSNHEKEKIEIADTDVFVHTWDVSLDCLKSMNQIVFTNQ
jgi:hypothetical protein